MSYPQRYIPPIYVDLNMPVTPVKDKEALVEPCSPESSNFTAEPRPSRTNSLILDLLEFPLGAADHNSDALLKCDLDSVVDVGNGHDTPAGSQQQIFPLPNGLDDALDQDVTKMKQSHDPEVVEEVAAFPAAVFTNTTISATRSVPNLVAQRGGRTSQFSAKQRRERHNANERRRTNAAKDRVRDMRDAVTALERQRADFTAQRDAKASANEILPHRRPMEDVLSRERVESELGHGIPGSSTYLDIVKSIDELRDEKRYLEEQLDLLDSQNSALQAVQAELIIDTTTSLTAAGAKKSLKRKRVEDDDDASDSKRMALECEMDIPAGGYCVETETVPSYLKVLFPEPMTSDAAFNWVKDSYGDIMALKAQQKPADTDAPSVLGWREDKREVVKSGDENSLELMMTQDFPGIVSGELVFNTWNLLTLLETFQKLFPLTKDLAVLQTINDDCVVVRVGIAPVRDAPVVHSIVVLARGQIDGGYLVSMRSVPLSSGQKAFAAGENYLPVLAWFMLLDKYDEYAQPVCEVIVGTSTQHKSERVLDRLATEFVAGVVRWQEAVGQSKHWML
ncbi:hypothetical protein PHMEG_00015603 [Phytophthora megakarya]|uniref:Uncharacterized protein n=1 Tax=Phytophthora megakarya TaxID=4795 RepID=A0A225W109_9STRA|nr:hypothetical protein PHMEG_00015603 [Phytophthora megakarya]